MAVRAGASVVHAWIAAGLRPYTAPENLLVALPMVPVACSGPGEGRSGTGALVSPPVAVPGQAAAGVDSGARASKDGAVRPMITTPMTMTVKPRAPSVTRKGEGVKISP